MTAHPSHVDVLSTLTDDALALAIANTEEAMARSEARGGKWHEGTGLACLRMLLAEQRRRTEKAA